MRSVLEDLPNELLLFIFNYLSVINLLYSFHRLNRRFSSLIRTIKHVHVDFSSHALSKTQFIHVINQLRSLNIESIRISTRYYIDAIPLLTSYLPPSQLIHLRSLVLIDADRSTIEKLVHTYPQLKSLSIESSTWRSIPYRFLPRFPHLTHCRLPILDFLKDTHSQITHLTLDHCTTENLTQLNTFVPNLRSLTLTLTQNTNIPCLLHFPVHLSSLKLILRSVLFADFERLITLTEHLKELTVTFNNTEHEVHCFDQYLSGESWYAVIANHVDHLQFNVIVHRTMETFIISDLMSTFDWFEKAIICQAIAETNGYHLFSLPFIDNTYTINVNNYPDNLFDRNDFNRVHHLYLIIPNHEIQYSRDIPSNCICRNLQTLTVTASTMNNSINSFIHNLIDNSHLRTLELRLKSVTNHCREFFDKLIHGLSSSVEMLVLNTASTRLLADLLENHNQLLPHIKRLLCAVKNRDEFDALILLLLELFQQKSLIYLSISLEHASRSSNFLSGWLLKTTYLKKARIKCSDRQCAIWI